MRELTKSEKKLAKDAMFMETFYRNSNLISGLITLYHKRALSPTELEPLNLDLDLLD